MKLAWQSALLLPLVLLPIVVTDGESRMVHNLHVHTWAVHPPTRRRKNARWFELERCAPTCGAV